MFLGDLYRELGPLAFVLIAAGARDLLSLRKHWMGVLPAVSYLTIIALWAHHDHRFLVPILPLAWILVGVGFDRAFISRRMSVKVLGSACLFGALAWSGIRLFESPRAQYYGFREAQYQEEYANLRAIGTQLASEPHGVILGWGRGEETVWWHEMPYVSAIWADRSAFEAFVHDFRPRYILTRPERIDVVKEVLPGATLLVQRGQFVVLMASEPSGLTRIIHEDVLQTQQLDPWRCFAGSGNTVDPERVVEEAGFRKVPPGAERPAKPAGCEVWCACS